MSQINKLLSTSIPLLSSYSGFLKSLLTVVCTVFFVSILYYQHTLNIITTTGEQTSQTITNIFVNSLENNLFDLFKKDPINHTDRLQFQQDFADFDKTVRQVMGGTNIAKVKIYDLSADTIYSTDFSQIGEDQSENNGYLNALASSIDSSLVYRDTFNSMDGIIENKDLIQTYIRVDSPTHSDIPLGVFELYTDVTPLIEQLYDSLFMISIIAAIVLLLLYGLHLWITLRAQRIINNQDTEIEVKIQALKNSESLTNTLFDSIQECILLVNREGKIIRSNQFVKQNKGLQLEGYPVADLLNDSVVSGEPNDAMVGINSTFSKASPQRGILIPDCMNNNNTLSLDIYPVLDSDRSPSLAILYLRNVTDELEKQALATHHEKLIGLGALATGYAHDLINPLTVLSSELELLDSQASRDELIKANINQKKSVERLIQIVSKMRAGLHSNVADNASCSTADAINNAIHQVRHAAAANEIKIQLKYHKDLPDVPIALENLVMVLNNILNNAIQSMPDGGNITIESKIHETGGISIVISDSGCGIPSRELPLVLDALYTTKPDGLGLGLTICNQLIRSVMGSLKITSKPGKGTTIEILFLKQ